MVFLNLSDKISQIGTISQTLLRKKSDVVILGASGAKYQYNCKILSDSLNLEVQNTGVKGMRAVYFDVVLQSYLERCVPQMVVIDVIGELDAGLGLFPRVKPFYGINKPVTEYYDRESDWQQKMKLKSSLYRYNETLDLLVRHVFNDKNLTNGFAVKTTSTGRIDTVVVSQFCPDSIQLRHLNNVVNLCHHHHIQMVMVLSPRRVHNRAGEQWFTDYCKENGIVLINELHVPVYYERDDVFFDESHLNGTGADIFSARIASYLKAILINKE
jgi:hypothetical protein